MIGFLRGELLVKKPPTLLIDVAGVGYELQATMHTFYSLPAIGANIALYIHMVVREDAQLLYGFATEQERTIFREIIKVSGIGPKLALTVLSGMNVVEFYNCVKTKNIAQLVNIPGIGTKTAERLLIEMQGKLEKFAILDPNFSTVLISTTASAHNIVQDAIDALLSLGYKAAEANKAVLEFAQTANDSETLIRQALKKLGK